MTVKETVDSILRLVEILTRWPLVFLYVTLLFRKPISNLLPALANTLAGRLRKVSVPGGGSVEFDAMKKLAKKFDPELTKQILLNLEPDELVETDDSSVEDDNEEYTEQSNKGDADSDSADSELNAALDSLRTDRKED